MELFLTVTEGCCTSIHVVDRTKEKSQKVSAHEGMFLGRVKETLSRDLLHFIGQNADTQLPSLLASESEKMSLFPFCPLSNSNAKKKGF